MKKTSIPKNHIIWTSYTSSSGEYKITSLEKDRSKYFLWKETEEGWEKIAQNVNPLKLEERIVY